MIESLAGELVRAAMALRAAQIGAGGISLASAIAAADDAARAGDAMRDAAQRVEAYLAVLFNLRRGWSVDPDTLRIDLYEALDNAAAAAVLHRAGFAAVTFHAHGPRQFLTCKCTTREATL